MGVIYLRLLLWLGCGALGLLAGGRFFQGDDRAVETERKRPAAQLTAIVRATAVEGDPEAALVAVRRSAGSAFGDSIIAHLRLVRDTPTSELGALLLQIERWGERDHTIIGNESNLLQEAIVERLKTEDPEALLALAATGKCHYLQNRPDTTADFLLDHFGYEKAVAQLDGVPFPRGATFWEAACLRRLAERDPQAVERHLLEDPRFSEYVGIWQHLPEETIDRAALDGNASLRVREFFISDAMGRLFARAPQAALEKFGELARAKDRTSALEGIGQRWDGSLAEAVQFADGLGSDQRRLKFLRRALSPPGPKVSVNRELASQAAMELDEGPVRRRLLIENFVTWKQYQPEEAEAWARANGVLELYEGVSTARRRLRP